MELNKENTEIDLKRCLYVLWKRSWILVLSAIIFAAATFSYAYFMIAPTYSSSVKIYVNNKYTESEGFSSSQLVAAQDLANTYMVILKSRSVMEKVAEQTALGYSSGELNRMISAHSINNTEVFEVVVTCSDYQHAAIIANAVADVLPDRISKVVESSSVQVVDYAKEDPNPKGPSYQKYILLGAVIGIALSAAIIILIDIMDTTIVSSEFLNHIYPDYPLLAVIPGTTNSTGGYSKGYYKGYYRGYYQSEPKREKSSQAEVKRDG